MTGAEPDAEDASITLARRFILISLVYFVIGTLWMGPIGTLIPGPPGVAGTLSDTPKMHLVFVGFVAFATIGTVYYVAPKIGGRQLHSRKLGSVHFWISNIFLPLAVLSEFWAFYAYVDIINAPGFSPENIPPALMGIFILTLFLFFVGIGAQAVFAYNIYKTMKRRP